MDQLLAGYVHGPRYNQYPHAILHRHIKSLLSRVNPALQQLFPADDLSVLNPQHDALTAPVSSNVTDKL